MKKPKLYIETSVWNFLFHDDSPEKKEVTERLFDEIEDGKYQIFISTIVIEEIDEADLSKKELLLSSIEKYAPWIIEPSEESYDLIQYYLSNQLLTQKQLADLGHVAIASTNAIDVLVSWNMRHIVKHKTRTLVNALNHIRGYHSIDICTPEEVIDNDIFR